MTSEEKVSEVISNFACSKDTDIENFIKTKALIYEKKSKSRTFLLFSKEAMEIGEFQLLAYFSIAMQVLKIPESTSLSQIRKLDGLYSKKGGEPITEIPAFLIGQLGKNEMFSSEVSGDEIVEYALSVISRAREAVGGRVVFIECQDKPKLIGFYERNGFTVLRQDAEDLLVQMYLLID